jgi:hypothetical protein
VEVPWVGVARSLSSIGGSWPRAPTAGGATSVAGRRREMEDSERGCGVGEGMRRGRNGF